MEDSRGSSGIGPGKSIGLAEGILLPAEAVESNRSRPLITAAENDLRIPAMTTCHQYGHVWSMYGHGLRHFHNEWIPTLQVNPRLGKL